MIITIFGGLNWFGKEMIERNKQSTFYIVDNCSSQNSCKTCFNELQSDLQNNYEIFYSCISNKDVCRQVIKESHVVIFNFLSKNNIIENHPYLDAFLNICHLCREYNVKIIYGIDENNFVNYYKNTIIHEIGCIHSVVYHNSIIIGPMKKRDKIEEIIHNIYIKNHFTLKNEDNCYSMTSQVVDTYIRAIDLIQIQVPYQIINDSSILYTIKQKIPKDRVNYTLLGDMQEENVLYNYIVPLVYKYFS